MFTEPAEPGQGCRHGGQGQFAAQSWSLRALCTTREGGWFAQSCWDRLQPALLLRLQGRTVAGSAPRDELWGQNSAREAPVPTVGLGGHSTEGRV